jgi:hypothetical protein
MRRFNNAAQSPTGGLSGLTTPALFVEHQEEIFKDYPLRNSSRFMSSRWGKYAFESMFSIQKK